MRAVGLFTHGGPEVLQVVELPEVHAGPGQVRIRVHAATVNPTDVMVRNGARAEQQKADPPPYVPGMEVAGIVDEVGSGVPDRLKVGDAVMAIVVPQGSHGAYDRSGIKHNLLAICGCLMSLSSPPFGTAALSHLSADSRASRSGISTSRRPLCAPTRRSSRSSIDSGNWSRPAKSHFAWQRSIRRKGRPMPIVGWRLVVREDG
jgi:hypothetical protein